MANSEALERTNESVANVTDDAPLRSIIDTPLTDALINGIFQQQTNDGSFPASRELGELFTVDFESIKRDLMRKGLGASAAEEIHRLLATAAILFYFLYHSQKTEFPVDLEAIQRFVSNARSELEGFSAKDDPIMQTYIDKGELAVKYVIDTREKYAHLCQELHLPAPTWESYVQRLMGLYH